MLCLDPHGTADLRGDAQGAEFVTSRRDGDMPAVRHGALVSPRHLAWPHSSKAISILTTAGAPCTSLGVFTLMQSHTRVGSDLSTAAQEYQCDKCSALACARKALAKEEGGSSRRGHQPVWDELRSLHGMGVENCPLQRCELSSCTDFCFLCSVLTGEAGAGSLLLL